MNRLHAIDVFEEIKDNQAEGREFCFKLYPSHVSIEPRLPRSTKSTKTRTTEVDMSTPSGRYHIHEVGLRIVNDQKCIIKVKNILRKSPSRMWENNLYWKWTVWTRTSEENGGEFGGKRVIARCWRWTISNQWRHVHVLTNLRLTMENSTIGHSAQLKTPGYDKYCNPFGKHGKGHLTSNLSPEGVLWCATTSGIVAASSRLAAMILNAALML